MTEAESQTGLANQQVSKWRRRLKEPEKYRDMLYGAAYHKAKAKFRLRTLGQHPPPAHDQRPASDDCGNDSG